jgi:hypothetical protein
LVFSFAALHGAVTLRTKALKEVCNVVAMISLEKDAMVRDNGHHQHSDHMHELMLKTLYFTMYTID